MWVGVINYVRNCNCDFEFLLFRFFNFAIFSERGMPVWTRKAIERIRQQVLEDVEAVNAYEEHIVEKHRFLEARRERKRKKRSHDIHRRM